MPLGMANSDAVLLSSIKGCFIELKLAQKGVFGFSSAQQPEDVSRGRTNGIHRSEMMYPEPERGKSNQMKLGIYLCLNFYKCHDPSWAGQNKCAKNAVPVRGCIAHGGQLDLAVIKCALPLALKVLRSWLSSLRLCI